MELTNNLTSVISDGEVFTQRNENLGVTGFDFEDTKKAVTLINGKCFAESSGNINEKTIRAYAECGVDFISSGALTHSIYNMDLSLKAVL